MPILEHRDVYDSADLEVVIGISPYFGKVVQTSGQSVLFFSESSEERVSQELLGKMLVGTNIDCHPERAEVKRGLEVSYRDHALK